MKEFLFVLACISLFSFDSSAENEWWSKLPRASWNRFQQIKQSQAWFEVYEIRPGIFAIYEPGQWEEVISYLIVGSKRALLLDTGLGIGNIKKLVSEITPFQPIVINTHTHIDHVGGNYQFQEIYGTDTEFSRENAKGKPHEVMEEEVTAEAIWKPTPAGFSAKNFTSKPFSITKTLHNGDQFDLGDRTLEVIFTPGHSPDSLCLIDQKNRFLFTGDTFYLAPLYVHVPGSDFRQFAQSAALLASLQKDVDFLMPAHNETLLTAEYLSKLNQACLDIESGKASFVKKEGNREYFFADFSILLKSPELR
jgi:glyoxylase-like metal-dependent hydrolase (beta-lactamase superfamily II)